MPTSRPRYQVTDTGRVRALLDRAAQAWPERSGERKALLLTLAEMGAEHLPEPEPAGPSDDDLRAHAGDWVALARGRMLVAGRDPAAVVAWLREHGERAEQLYRLPLTEEDVAAEHALA